jgi:hypothetical protein
MSRLSSETTPLGESELVPIFPEGYPQVTNRVLALMSTKASA